MKLVQKLNEKLTKVEEKEYDVYDKMENVFGLLYDVDGVLSKFRKELDKAEDVKSDKYKKLVKDMKKPLETFAQHVLHFSRVVDSDNELDVK